MGERFYDLDLFEGWILAWWKNFGPDHRDQSVLNLRWQHDHTNLVWRKRLLCFSSEWGPNTPCWTEQPWLDEYGLTTWKRHESVGLLVGEENPEQRFMLLTQNCPANEWDQQIRYQKRMELIFIPNFWDVHVHSASGCYPSWGVRASLCIDAGCDVAPGYILRCGIRTDVSSTGC